MLTKSLVLCFLAAAFCAAAENKPLTPEDAATRFYRAYLALSVSGLPDAKQLRALQPFLAPDLVKLIHAAQRKQAKAIKDRPDEKPPWAEGDLFSSLFEGANAFEAEQARMDKDRAEVALQLRHTEGKETTRWTDTIVLTKHKEEWLVSDILLNGKWDFKPGKSLRQILGAP